MIKSIKRGIYRSWYHFWICRKIKDCLQRILILKANDISKKKRVELEVLIDHFSLSCPFKPMDILDLNLANATTFAGLGFTYVIVLLQFKVADRFDAPDGCFNSTCLF